MTPIEVLMKSFVADFNNLSEEIELDLNQPPKENEVIREIEYTPTVKEYLETYNQSRINKRSTAYWHYKRLYEEKKNNPEFSKYADQDFGKLIKFNREFKKLLDSFSF
jgi:broad specificity polyphosphatase/5'/3'-nucleotidase SurE